MYLSVAIDSPCKGCYNLREQNFCSDSEKDFYNPVKTTGLAGGLFCPYKGLLPAYARKAY